jgi:hypothetical protein
MLDICISYQHSKYSKNVGSNAAVHVSFQACMRPWRAFIQWHLYYTPAHRMHTPPGDMPR